MKQLFREEGLMDHLPTYEEYTKDMPLVDQIKFYYDVDIDNYLGDLGNTRRMYSRSHW